MPAVATTVLPVPPRPRRHIALDLLQTLTQAAALLGDVDLSAPEVQAALAVLGRDRNLMRLLLASRLAHHRVAQWRLTCYLAEGRAAADAYPAAAAFREPLR